MAELLVWVGPPAVGYEPGDVIVARPDGHDWGIAERTEPRWRIVRLQLTGAAIEALTASEVDADGGLLRRRGCALDLGSVRQAEDRAWLEDSGRRAGIRPLALSAAYKPETRKG